MGSDPDEIRPYSGDLHAFRAELLPKLISTTEAAKRSHYSKRTIQRKLKAGKILGCKLHGKGYVVWPLEFTGF